MIVDSSRGTSYGFLIKSCEPKNPLPYLFLFFFGHFPRECSRFLGVIVYKYNPFKTDINAYIYV